MACGSWQLIMLIHEMTPDEVGLLYSQGLFIRLPTDRDTL